MGNQDELDKALKALDEVQGKSHQKIIQQPIGDRVKALASLQGNLYQYPLNFLHTDLKAGNLKPSVGDAEDVLPSKTFT
jgi:hypothetical protein